MSGKLRILRFIFVMFCHVGFLYLESPGSILYLSPFFLGFLYPLLNLDESSVAAFDFEVAVCLWKIKRNIIGGKTEPGQ